MTSSPGAAGRPEPSLRSMTTSFLGGGPQGGRMSGFGNSSGPGSPISLEAMLFGCGPHLGLLGGVVGVAAVAWVVSRGGLLASCDEPSSPQALSASATQIATDGKSDR